MKMKPRLDINKDNKIPCTLTSKNFAAERSSLASINLARVESNYSSWFEMVPQESFETMQKWKTMRLVEAHVRAQPSLV